MLTLICGCSRVGKTTYSQAFDNVIHLDDVGIPQERYAIVNRLLVSLNGDIVVEGIYDRASLRIALLNAYKGIGKRCIWLDPSEEEVRSRPWGRKHGFSKHSFEPPTYSEGWDEIIIIGEHNGEPN